MSYTFSHPILIYPLWQKRIRKYFNFSGLFFGSLSPDFEYYLTLNFNGSIGHFLPQALWFSILSSFLITYIFHNLLKTKIITSLPLYLEKRLAHYKNQKFEIGNTAEFVIFSYSVLIGMSSHLFLDHLTHQYGYFVTRSDFLNLSIPVLNVDFKLYELLLLFSNIFGVLAFLFFIKALNHEPKKDINSLSINVKIRFWVSWALFVALLSIAFVILFQPILLGETVLIITSAAFLSMLCFSRLILMDLMSNLLKKPTNFIKKLPIFKTKTSTTLFFLLCLVLFYFLFFNTLFLWFNEESARWRYLNKSTEEPFSELRDYNNLGLKINSLKRNSEDVNNTNYPSFKEHLESKNFHFDLKTITSEKILEISLSAYLEFWNKDVPLSSYNEANTGAVSMPGNKAVLHRLDCRVRQIGDKQVIEMVARARPKGIFEKPSSEVKRTVSCELTNLDPGTYYLDYAGRLDLYDAIILDLDLAKSYGEEIKITAVNSVPDYYWYDIIEVK